MKYLKIYEAHEDSELPEEKMNGLFLKDLLEALKQEEIKTARVSPQNSKVLEVSEEESKQAKEVLKECLLIVDTSKQAISSKSNLVIGDKIDLLKLIFISLLYIFGGATWVILKMEEVGWKENWWYLILFFTPVFALHLLAPRFFALTTPFPLNLEDEAWMLKGKSITRTAVWFFWIFALLWMYLLISTEEVMWGGILEGNMTSLRLALDYLSPVVFIGASLYLFKVMFHRRVYLNPKAFTPAEIEKIKLQKEKVISEIKHKP